MEQIGYSEKPIVIVGCQRSGTTLLRTILGRHPQLLEHPDEPQFILELYQRFGYKVRDVETAVTYLLKHPYLPDTITAEALRAAYATDKQLTLHDFFQKFLQVWAGERLLTQRPILKHPAFTYHLDLVATLFPQAIIIHIVRDPRANVSSQKIAWKRFTTIEGAMLWKQAIQDVRKWIDKKNNLFVIEVCYENIITNPKEAMALLCQQLGIPFEPVILSSEKEMPDTLLKKEKNSLDPSRLNQWQKRLAPIDIRLIEHICQQEMRSRRYEPTTSVIPKPQFYTRLFYEYLYYFYKINGRRLKNLLRKAGWRLGIGLLKIPPSSLD